MPYKNYLEVEKETEKQLYRICKELELFGKSITERTNSETDRWCSVSRTIGIRGKPLIEHKPPLLYPPTRTRNSKHYNLGIILTPPNIVIKEKIKGKKSFFHFTRKK